MIVPGNRPPTIRQATILQLTVGEGGPIDKDADLLLAFFSVTAHILQPTYKHLNLYLTILLGSTRQQVNVVSDIM